MTDLLVPAVVLVPFVAWIAIAFSRGRGAEAISVGAALLSSLAAGLLLSRVLAGGAPEVRPFPLVPGVDLVLRADALGSTFAFLATGLWVATAVYASIYARAVGLPRRARFFAAFAASIAAATGTALAGNLLTFLVFYELLTVSTYPLVVHKETPEAVAAGRRYLAYALSGGVCLTLATVWTWSAAGTLEFVPGGFLAGRISGAGSTALFALFVLGCGVKSAIMPLHGWLPAAMVAPTPVSALLHAVAVVKAGVFGFLRVLGFVFGPESLEGSAAPAVLLAACGATIVVGSFAAIGQDHLKRRLAYSTIVQLSYVVLGAALLVPWGTTGAVIHMVNHGVAKITLFFAAGAIYVAAHRERVSDLRGLGRRMPWTFAAFTIGALGLIGIPGLCGFVGKYFLARGALDAGRIAYALVLVGGSVLTAAYLLPILRVAYLEPSVEDEAAREAPAWMVAPALATAALVVVLGAVPAVVDVQHELAARVAASVHGGAP